MYYDAEYTEKVMREAMRETGYGYGYGIQDSVDKLILLRGEIAD